MKRWSIGLGLVALWGCAAEAEPVSVVSQALNPGDKLVIRAVYGGGGNGDTAPFVADFVELFNAGQTTVSLAGLSVQYGAVSGGSAYTGNGNITVLPDASLLPGQSYLVRGANGNTTTRPELPTPHLVDSTPFAMGAAAGRVALVNGTTSITASPGACSAVPCTTSECVPCNADPRVIDLAGWGVNTNAGGITAVAEGSPAGATTSATGISRAANGCQDTNDNSVDFTVEAPAPRTTASELQPCPAPVDDAGAAEDAGSEEEDAAVDAGPAPIDAGSESDAGSDAGPVPGDAGSEEDAAVDAGSPSDGGSDGGVVLPELPEGLLIRQVYGGGGNGGAELKADFIELFNAGTAQVSLAQLSLQYAPATGMFGYGSRDSSITTIDTGTLAPGQSFLMAGATGNNGTVDLPTPDLVDPTPLAMGGSSGRIALVLGHAPLTCSQVTCSAAGCVPCTQDPRVIDLVGYGDGEALSDGTSVPALSSTTSASRRQGGCQDTNDNAADFEVGTPTPRNTASPLAVCGTVVDPVDAGTDPVDAGGEPTPDAGVTPVDAGSDQDAAVSVDAGSEPGDGSDQDGSDEDGGDEDGSAGDGVPGDGWFDDGSDGIEESKDSSCSVTSYGQAGSTAPLAFAGLALVLARRRRRRL